MKTTINYTVNDALAIVAFDYFLLHDFTKTNLNKKESNEYVLQRQHPYYLFHFEKLDNDGKHYQFYKFNNILIRIENEKNRNYSYLNINENLDFILTFGKNGFYALLKSDSNILYNISYYPNKSVVKIFINENHYSYKLIELN